MAYNVNDIFIGHSYGEYVQGGQRVFLHCGFYALVDCTGFVRAISN